jgi:hypothetical protein
MIVLAGCGGQGVKVVALHAEAAPGKEQPAGKPPAAPAPAPLAKKDPSAAAGRAAPEPAANVFRFPDDSGGRLLANLLPPRDRSLVPPGIASQRQPQAAPSSLEDPSLPLPAHQASLPRLPLDRRPSTARPGPLADEAPLAGSPGVPTVPQVQQLPAGERVRLPAADVNQPAPLPLLAQPRPDRAPLDDPTHAASAAAAVAAPPPARTDPVPFAPLNLPNPFERREAVKLPDVPAEDAAPSTSGVRPPRP